jgi:UDP-N-acetylglucosamine kinase
MNEGDLKLGDDALQWVKANQKEVVARFVGNSEPAPEQPVSIFMAGSPGAGKTEFSRRLIDDKFGPGTKFIVRIDPDEIREWLPNYIAGKAECFQGAVSVSVEKIHDHVLEKKKSFLLDGTLSNLDRARANIKRSHDKGRALVLEYVYQDPLVAWDFTKKREVIEGRNIPREAFVDQFFAARENATILKKEFGKDLVLDIVIRDISTGKYSYEFNVDNIDNYIKHEYNKEELLKRL